MFEIQIKSIPLAVWILGWVHGKRQTNAQTTDKDPRVDIVRNTQENTQHHSSQAIDENTAGFQLHLP